MLVSKITATADNGFYLGYWNQFLNSSVSVGDLFAGNTNIGLAFRDIIIPPGSIIKSAKLVFISVAPKTGSCISKIYGQAVDNFTVFGTLFPQDNTTTEFVDWVLPDMALDVAYDTPDISNIIQEIIDRAGWQSGNSIGLGLINNGSAAGVIRAFYTYANDPEKAATLEIVWELRLTIQPKNNITIIGQSADSGRTWDQADMTWDENTDAWDKSTITTDLTKQSKNNISLNLLNK